MTETIAIDPVVRLEGHYSVKVDVDGGKVVDARSTGTLFRGIETIIAGRDPRDAPTIASAICGVCVSEHQIASALSLEDAAKISPPRNGVVIRNIVEGATTIYSHALHIVVLTGPDYNLYGLGNENWSKILKTAVLPASQLCHQIVALFGGKSPHYWSVAAGGESMRPSPNIVEGVKSRISSVKKIIDEYAPTILDYLDKHPELQDYGVGPGNFLAYGVYPDPDKPSEMFLKRGVVIDGARQSLDIEKISEDVRYSWYTNESGGRPEDEPLPKPSYGKQDAYTWLKAPRYDGKAVEVGPLARMVVSGYYSPKSKLGASIYDRLVARALEMVKITEEMSSWAGKLVSGESVYTQYNVPESARGLGLWEAPRGALAHWVRIEKKKIANYQVISPSTWNCSPRDDKDQKGPLEQALIGVPVPDTKNPLEVGRTVRSYDPCLACSVHLVEASGKTRTIRV